MEYDFSPFAEKYQQSTIKNYFIPNWIVIAVGIASLVATFCFKFPLYFVSMVAIYIFAQRSGHKEGYIEGVEDGVTTAIKKNIQVK